MTIFEAYFDESGCDDQSKILAVGGYLFEAEKAKRADKKWRQVLRDYDLPYFHMVDCAHGNKPFDKLSGDQCIEVEKRMIELIKRYAITGFVSLVNPGRYHNNLGTDAYTSCVHSCALAITSMVETLGIPGKVALFFEAGHSNGPKANHFLYEAASKGSGFSDVYASHTFAKKEEVRLLQAADLLVWQYAKFIKDKVWSTRKPRADFKSLVQHRHSVIFTTALDETAIIATDEHPSPMHNDHRDKIITAFFSDDDRAMKAFTAQATQPERLIPVQESLTKKVFTASINWDDL